MKSFFKLSPVFVLAGLMMISNIPTLSNLFGFKLDVLIIAPIATVYAAIVAKLTTRTTVSRLIDVAVHNVSSMQLVFFILMLAYAMAEIFMVSGVGASIINISISLGLSARTAAMASFLVSALLSVATGTSWGTFASCAPIFLWLTHILGGNVAITMSAVAGGSCFGDNLGLISDCTVVSSGIHRVEITDRLRNQWAWAMSGLVIAAALFFIVSLGLPTHTVTGEEAVRAIPESVWESLKAERPTAVSLLEQVKTGVPVVMILPLLLVIITAFLKVPTLLCLGAGIFSAYGMGLIVGTIPTTATFLSLMQVGFSSAGSWVIIMMMWVGAFGGIMARMDAFRPLAKLTVKLSRNSKQLMFWNGVLSFLGNAALADEMAQIVTVGPIIRDVTDETLEGAEPDLYKFRLRNATFSSALGVFGSQLLPWHVYINFFLSISSSIYPLYHFTFAEMIRYNYMAFVAVGSLLLLTFTGTDRFLPNFGLPHERITMVIKKNQEEAAEA